jgi:hypothetical protein
MHSPFAVTHYALRALGGIYLVRNLRPFPCSAQP